MPRVRGGDEAERQDEGGNPTVDVRHVFADRGHAPTGTRQAARRAPGWPLRAWRVRVRRNTRTDLTSRPRPETGKELKELSDGLTEIRDSGPAARGATLLALTNTAGSTLAGLCDWSFAAGLSPERVTTEPAPITVPSPMVTPGRMLTLEPTHTLRPICTGSACV